MWLSSLMLGEIVFPSLIRLSIYKIRGSSKDVKIVDRQGSFVMYSLARDTAPDLFKSQLWDLAVRLSGEPDENIDSATRTDMFAALHLSLWCKYNELVSLIKASPTPYSTNAAAQGPGVFAPEAHTSSHTTEPPSFKNVPPPESEEPDPTRDISAYLLAGHHSQRLPHPSADLLEHLDDVEYLTRFLQPLIDIIVATIMKQLPVQYHCLSVNLQRIPNSEPIPTAPFCGYVLNLHVATEVHKDDGDPPGGLCVVVVFGEFEGGSLVLYEPGLRLDLKNGDVVMFPSSRISHFNLHYRGKRGSIVMHGDRWYKTWVEGKTGWKLI